MDFAPVVPAPVFAQGVILFGCNKQLVRGRGQTGKEKWRFRTRNWIIGSVAVQDGTGYFGNGRRHAVCVDLDSGKEIWRFERVNGSLALRLSRKESYISAAGMATCTRLNLRTVQDTSRSEKLVPTRIQLVSSTPVCRRTELSLFLLDDYRASKCSEAAARRDPSGQGPSLAAKPQDAVISGFALCFYRKRKM